MFMEEGLIILGKMMMTSAIVSMLSEGLFVVGGEMTTSSAGLNKL